MDWRCQIGVLCAVRIKRYAGDFAFGIDEAGGQQIQRIVSGDERVEIYERAVPSDEGANHAEIRIRRKAHDLTSIVDPKPEGVIVIADYTQILHLRVCARQESVSSLVASQIRLTDYLAEVVNAMREVVELSSQVAEVDGLPISPKQRMSRVEIQKQDRVERGTAAR